MPTKKPRIAVTVSPHVFDTLERLAKLTGKGRGAFISELLESSHPALMRTVALLDAASEAPSNVKRGIVGTLEQMERELVGGVGGSIAQMDWLLGEIGEASEDSDEGPPKSQRPPRPVTRGVGTTKQEVRSGGKVSAKSSKKRSSGGHHG
jgi:hypothetical protein